MFDALKGTLGTAIRLAASFSWPVLILFSALLVMLIVQVAAFVATATAAAELPGLAAVRDTEDTVDLTTRTHSNTLPGTSLAKSDEIGRRVEQILLAEPEVIATARRTGRCSSA
jgi:Cu/Ag efflux pump CusA